MGVNLTTAINFVTTCFEYARRFFGKIFDAIDPKAGLFLTSCILVWFVTRLFILPLVGGNFGGSSDLVKKSKEKGKSRE